MADAAMNVRLGDAGTEESLMRAKAEAELYRDSGRAATRDTPHPVLARAGELIREYGWVTHNWHTHEGVCALYAVEKAAREAGVLPDGPKDVLSSRVALATGRDLSVPSWNDSREHVNEVLALLY